jgi:hypothetical protein
MARVSFFLKLQTSEKTFAKYLSCFFGCLLRTFQRNFGHICVYVCVRLGGKVNTSFSLFRSEDKSGLRAKTFLDGIIHFDRRHATQTHFTYNSMMFFPSMW